MNLLRFLVVLFITLPLLELYVLIQVGGLIGVMPTIMLCVLTAITGAALMRYQGLRTITTLQEKLARGEFPAQDLLEGVILLCGGILLLTPGFITDILGFICLIPPCRTWIARILGQQLVQRSSARQTASSVTIEGEYWREERRPDPRLDQRK